MKWTSCVRAAGGLTCHSSPYRRVGRARLALLTDARVGAPLLAAARIAVAAAARRAAPVGHVAGEDLVQEADETVGGALADRQLRRADLLQGRGRLDRLHPVVVLHDAHDAVEAIEEGVHDAEALATEDQLTVPVAAARAKIEVRRRSVVVREGVLIDPPHQVVRVLREARVVHGLLETVRGLERDLAAVAQIDQVRVRTVLGQDDRLARDADHEDPVDGQAHQIRELVGVTNENAFTHGGLHWSVSRELAFVLANDPYHATQRV